MTDKKNYFELVQSYERKLICDVLEQTRGNQARAARLLGLSPTTFSSLIRRLNINVGVFRQQPRQISLETLERLLLWKSNRPWQS